MTADDDVAKLQWIKIEELQSKDFGLRSIARSIERFKKMYENNEL